MPRQARQHSETGIYHVMVRGNEKKYIFVNDEDRQRFLQILSRLRKNGNIDLYAYCLMENHVHLLIKEGTDPISQAMKRITVSYATYFNKKYDRVGHFFQDRFRSEAVDNDSYLLTAARYIHNNPVKAGLVKDPKSYDWSSYRYYLEDNPLGIQPVNIELILSLFADDRHRRVKKFMDFSREPNDDQLIDVDKNCTLEARNTQANIQSLKVAVETFLRGYGITIEDLKNNKCRSERDHLLRELKQSLPISVRQLSLIIGVSKDTVARA